MKIGKEKCKCGHAACGTWWLTGVGRFVQGGGFSENEAKDIVRKLGAHDALVSALCDLENIFDGQEDCDDGVPNDAMRAMTIIHAAMAKVGEA